MARSDNFRGSNNPTSTKNIFNERAKYKVRAWPGIAPHMVKDFTFAEIQLYGIVDAKGRPLIPNKEFLTPLVGRKNKPGIPVVFDFIADMFKDVRSNIQSACAGQLLPQVNPFIVNMDPVQAYTSPRNDYEKYIKQILTYFNQTIIPNRFGIHNITSIEDYVKAFFLHLSNNFVDQPITLSRWCQSPYASLFHTGLAIDIAGFNQSEDQVKIQQFIDDPMFNYYKKILINRGFSIVHNAPWIIVADLQSPAIARYMTLYRFRNLQDIFNKRHIYTNTIDINIIYNYIRRYYNYLVLQYPFTKITKAHTEIKYCRSQTYSEIIRRNSVSAGHFNSLYPEEDRICTYIDLRNLEEGLPFSEGRIRQMKKYTKKLIKMFDTDKAMSYIVLEFKDQTFQKDFGFRHIVSRINAVKQEEIEEQTSNTTVSGGSASY